MSICISDDPRIERDIRQNFMCPECEADGYKLRMLESNKIPGLLQLKVSEEDGRKHLLYDISSRESLKTVLMNRVITKEQVENFVFCLNRILLCIDSYLLDAGDLVMKPEYIYVSEDLEPSLCCVPDYCGNFAAALSDVLRDMLGAVDQRDHTAVVLAYRLYQKTLESHYVMQDLIKILESEEPHDERSGKKEKEKPVFQNTPAERTATVEGTGIIERNPAKERHGTAEVLESREHARHPGKTSGMYEDSLPSNDELFDLMSSDTKKSRRKKRRFFLF